MQMLTGDLSSGNVRCFDGFKARARAFNAEAEATGCTGRVLCITGLCSSHIITRGVVAAFRHDKLIPRLFHLTWCLRFPARWRRYMHVVRKTIEADLSRGGFFPGVDPPAANRRRTECVLRLTLLRPLRTRGRVDLDGGGAKSEATLLRKRDQLLAAFPGDIRRACCEYFGDASLQAAIYGPRCQE